jgi:glucokinase
MKGAALCVDIGGTKISVARLDEHGVIARKRTIPTPALTGPTRVLGAVAELLEQAAADCAPGTPVGVGSAGVIDRRGQVLSATNSITGWQGFPLASALSAITRRSVYVLNDVHAAALAEAELGSGHMADAFLMITVGTGVGGALYDGGSLRRGVTGTAGSVGHLAARGRSSRICTCGQPGHVEAYASGPGMERTFTEVTGDVASLRKVAALADEGHEAARATIAEGARTLGWGVADALNVLDYGLVVIGGGVASIGSPYFDAVEAAIRNGSLPGPATARVVPARLGADATLVGAGLHALTMIAAPTEAPGSEHIEGACG